jgi:hypothetical protein
MASQNLKMENLGERFWGNFGARGYVFTHVIPCFEISPGFAPFAQWCALQGISMYIRTLSPHHWGVLGKIGLSC